MTPDLWPRLFGPAELEYLARQSDAGLAATILFCAKEACHKAGRERVLRFLDLNITLAEASFAARRDAEEFQGRFGFDEDLVLAAAWPR